MNPVKDSPLLPRLACGLFALFLSVAPGNAATPELGSPAAQTTSRNVVLVFSSTNGNAITITNAGAGTNKLELTLSLTQGTATLKGTSGLTFTLGDGTNDSVMTFRGTSTNINTALNGLVFTPSSDYFGAAALTLMTPAAEFAALNADGALAGRYNFDNTSALGQDTSPGGTQSGTVSNATTAADAERGAVLNLDALDGADYLQVSGRFGDPANVTLTAWVNLVTADSLGSEVITLGDKVSIVLDSSTNLVGSFFNGLIYRTVSYPTTLAGAGWHHVAYTMDDAGNAQRLYLDGVQVASSAQTESISYFLASNTTIGKHPVFSTLDFTGNIDEARVYTRVLSALEIGVLANDLSARTTNTVPITVVAPPVIASQPASQLVVEGTNVVLSVTADGTTPLAYRWTYNGTNISGATNSTLDLTSIAVSAAGNYTVIVTNSFGSVTSQVAVLTVLSLPPILAAKDTYIRSAADDLNYGASTSLIMDSGGSGLGNHRVLLQFDLSAIPVGSIIIDATLLLQATSTTNGPVDVEVHQITQYWEEGSEQGSSGATSWAERIAGSSWNTAGGSFDSAVVASLNTSATGQHSWNVTTLVQSWVTAGSTNYGLLLGSPNTGSRRITYHSREGTTPPQLLIRHYPPPVITSQPVDESAMEGQAVTLMVTASGEAPLSYRWVRDGSTVAGATNSSLNLTNLALSDSGNYRVIVSNFVGSVTSVVAVLTVQPLPPTITTQPVSQIVLEGANVSFSVVATSIAPLSYQWALFGSSISGATNSSLSLTNVPLSASGDYSVLIQNSGGFVASAAATLTVQPAPPTIVVQPVSRTVNEGTNVSLTVTTTGTAPLQYQWWLEATNTIAGATNSSLGFTNVPLSASGNYTVVVSNSVGSVTSQVAVLTVQAVAPSITSQPVSRTVDVGTNVSFSVTATGTAPLAYQWVTNSAFLSGATNIALNLTNVAVSDSGNYKVIISNSAGSVTSQVAVLTVQVVPPTITSQPVSRVVNYGDDVSFSVTATGTAPLQYQWGRACCAIPGETNSMLNFTNVIGSESGLYWVAVSNSAGSLVSSVATLGVQPVPPTITSQPASEATTVGSTVILSVTATGSPTLQYQWLRSSVPLTGETNSTLTMTNVQADQAGTYHVQVFNDQGSVNSVQVGLTVTVAMLAMTDNFTLTVGSTNFTGTGQSSNTLATLEVDEPLHDGKPGGKSMWFAWQAPASGIATFSTAGSDFDTLLAVYQGDAVNALVPIVSDDDEAGFYNSQVQFNVDSNAVYHIAVDGAGGVSGTIILQWNLEVTSDVLPVITNQPVSRIVGVGSNAVFTVGAAGAGLNYQWFLDGASIPNGTNSAWNLGGVGIPDVGQYRVQVTLGTRTVRSKRAGLQVTLTPEFDQDVLIEDKFIEMIAGGRNLKLDPPPSSSFQRLGVSPSGGSRGFSGSQVFSTVGSLKEPGEPNHCGVPGGASQWFAYEALTDGVLELNTDGSTFDTVLAVYTGAGAEFSSLTPLVCDNDSGTNGLTSSLHFITTIGTIYYIAIDGVNGASGVVVLNYTTLGEQQPPTITITSAPPVNIGLTNDTIILSGTAADNTELSAVEWRVTNSLGTTSWTNATGTNAWTFTIPDLAFGLNTVQIRSLDSWANVSAIASRVYLRLAPLTVTIDGCGTLSPGFLGTTYREPGKAVSITAEACADFLFAGWTGDVTSDEGKFSMLIQTGMVIQANFVTNQFALRPGTYVGLVYDTNVLDYERAGSISIRTTSKGTYSGKLLIGAKKRSFRGSFGIDGLSTNLVSRGRTEPPIELHLDFNLNATVESLTGRLMDTNWTGELTANRAVFHSRNNPAPYEGRYTLLLAANGSPGTPDGDGYGSVKVSSKGSVRIKGALGDGTKFSQGASMSVDGLWPFYVPLRRGSGSVFSWLLFETNSMLFGTNTVQSDIAGDVRWISLAAPTARYYPDGFTNAIVAAGSRYIPPSGGDNGALSFSNGVVVFNGGDLSGPFSNDVFRAVNDKFTDEGTNKLSLKVSRSSGLLKGSVVVPDTGQKVSFKGAIFQNGDFGFGYFLHTNASGAILLAPRE